MKVQHIKTNINEAVNKKIKLDEDSFFEGYSFVTNGKDITTVDIDSPLFTIDKDSIVVKWSGKLEMHNNGVYAFNVDVKSVAAMGEDQAPLNFNGFDFDIEKIKNPELQEVQIFIRSLFIATEEKKIYVKFTI